MTVIPIVTKPATFGPKSLTGQFCLSPFVMIEVTLHGDVRLCGCNDWMPTTIGNLLTHSIEEILSGPLAQKIRQSIIDGTYQYCNEKLCGVIANNGLNTFDTLPQNVQRLITDSKLFDMPHWISIQGDDTCNLSCPSCRTTVIKTDPNQIKKRKQLGSKLSQHLFSLPTAQPIIMQISNSGEIFASPLLLSFLSKINLSVIPNFNLILQSNGLLAKKNWHKISHLEKSIKQVMISIDAATPGTYELIRRGGKWKQLVDAMKFLQSKKHQLNFSFRTRMVVQDRNHKEIQQFYHFSKSFDVDRIEYSKITNWNTWSNEEFMQHDIFNKHHPNHSALTTELEAIKSLPGVWCHGIF